MTLDTNFGAQPLDVVMETHGLSNGDLVKVSSEQLTFKMVQKGRKGKRLTSNMQKKVLRALQKALPDEVFKRTDLFNY